jgi:hypothetical protein
MSPNHIIAITASKTSAGVATIQSIFASASQNKPSKMILWINSPKIEIYKTSNQQKIKKT